MNLGGNRYENKKLFTSLPLHQRKKKLAATRVKKKNLTLFTSLHTHDSLLQARHHLLLTNLMCVYSERERRGEGGAEGNGDGEERERERRER